MARRLHGCRRAAAALALAAAAPLLLLLLLVPLRPADATLVSAVEAVTRGLGARIKEFKGGEALVVTPADIEGLLNSPCGEWRGVGWEGGRKRVCAAPPFPLRSPWTVRMGARRRVWGDVRPRSEAETVE